MSEAFRTEKDALGEARVPADRLWGAQTQRSIGNFPIGVLRFRWDRPVIRAFGIVKLAIGEAVVEITPMPHRGCAKFAQRFGRDALRLVNSAAGRSLNLRGVNAKVVQSGTIREGDLIRRLDA